jgi:hypothetical protein
MVDGMKTFNLTEGVRMIIHEHDDHGEFAWDDEGNVYLEINGRTQPLISLLTTD